MLRTFQRRCSNFLRHLFFPEEETRWNSLNRRIDEGFENVLDLIKATHDILQVPKARGNLRALQIANAALLKRVVGMLDANQIPYWLGSGTLIGAVRHGGFIPWDDDIDICTTREGHNRILNAFVKTYGSDGDIFAVKSDCIRVYERNSPCQIDIFAWDVLSVPAYDEKTLATVKKSHDEKCRQIKYDFSKLSTQGRTIVCPTDEQIIEMADAFKKEFVGSQRIILEGFEESHHSFNCWRYEDVFPLAKIEFEGMPFNCPKKANEILSLWYGDYMSYPSSMHRHDDIINRIDKKWLVEHVDLMR